MVRLEDRDGIAENDPPDGPRVDAVAHGHVLQLGMDARRRTVPLDAADRAREHEPLDPVVAVEAGAVITDLDQPLPHHVGPGVDRQRLGVMRHHWLDDVIAGQPPRPFVCLFAPHSRSRGRISTS